MSRIINDTGDIFTPTEKGRGVDISSQRADELDEESLRYIKSTIPSGHKIKALDLGGGFGTHSIRMAQAGAQVYFIDVDCTEAKVNFAKAVQDQQIEEDSIISLCADFRDIHQEKIPEEYWLLYSQRALHYIKYEEANKLLKIFFNQMADGGKAFLSVAGYDTEYGKTFPDREKPVQDRFALVTEDMRIKHGIEHPIVIYTEDEFRMLLEETGFTVESVNLLALEILKPLLLKLFHVNHKNLSQRLAF